MTTYGKNVLGVERPLEKFKSGPLDRLPDRRIQRRGPEQNDPALQMKPLDRPGCLDSIHPMHADVAEHNVRLKPFGQRDRFLTL